MDNGILYVCGTPIGNLEDISLRVLKILKEADIIGAEDTRYTLKLLNRYNIKTRLTSYHEHNKIIKGPKLIELLKEGKNIALVSDAGMPGISDPGEDLIRLCYENNIKVTSAPGPTAVISALVLSGLSTKRYVFEGFLPHDKKSLVNILESLKYETRTIIIYESPHHLIKTLNLLFEYLGNRNISVVREITKQYEQVIRGDFIYILGYFKENEPIGEFVIVIEGEKEEVISDIKKQKWQDISIEEHLQVYSHLDKKEAMKQVAKDRGVSKRDIYNEILKTKKC